MKSIFSPGPPGLHILNFTTVDDMEKKDKRIKIYAGPPIMDFLDAHAGKDGNMDVSRLINRAVDRYCQTVRRNTPTLFESEWNLLFDSLNGGFEDDPLRFSGIPGGVSDSIQLDGLDEKWGVDGQVLIEKLNSLSFLELMSISDVVERYWDRFNMQTVSTGTTGTIHDLLKLPKPNADKP